jgi:hypothetical protein
MRENGSTTESMDKACTFGAMGTNTKENGSKESNMVADNSSGHLEQSTLDSSRRT